MSPVPSAFPDALPVTQSAFPEPSVPFADPVEVDKTISNPTQLGIRSGIMRVGQELNDLAGQTGLALGLKDFADSRFKSAAEFGQAAMDNTPPTADFGDASKSLAGLSQFVGHMAGGMVAPLAVAAATGRTLRNARAGVGVGFGALGAGQQVGTLRADPVAKANLTDNELLGNAAITGGIHGALFAGPGAPGQIARGAAGLIKGAGGQAIAMGGADLASQTMHQQANPAKQIDYEQVGGAAASGAAIGGVMGGAHALAAPIAKGIGKGAGGLGDFVAKNARELRERFGKKPEPEDLSGEPSVQELDKARTVEDVVELLKSKEDGAKGIAKQVWRTFQEHPWAKAFKEQELDTPEGRSAFAEKYKDHYEESEIKPRVDKMVNATKTWIKGGMEYLNQKRKPAEKLDGKKFSLEEDDAVNPHPKSVDLVKENLSPQMVKRMGEETIVDYAHKLEMIIKHPEMLERRVPAAMRREFGKNFFPLLQDVARTIHGPEAAARVIGTLKRASKRDTTYDDTFTKQAESIVNRHLRPTYFADADMRAESAAQLAPEILDHIERPTDSAKKPTKIPFPEIMDHLFGDRAPKVMEEFEALHDKMRAREQDQYEPEGKNADVHDDLGQIYEGRQDVMQALDAFRDKHGYKQHVEIIDHGDDKFSIEAKDTETLAREDFAGLKGYNKGPDRGELSVKLKGEEYPVNVSLVKLTGKMMEREGQQTQEGGAKYVWDMFSRGISSLVSSPHFEEIRSKGGLHGIPDSAPIGSLGGRMYTYGDIKRAQYTPGKNAQGKPTILGELQEKFDKAEAGDNKLAAAKELSEYYANNKELLKRADKAEEKALDHLYDHGFEAVEKAIHPMERAVAGLTEGAKIVRQELSEVYKAGGDAAEEARLRMMLSRMARAKAAYERKIAAVEREALKLQEEHRAENLTETTQDKYLDAADEAEHENRGYSDVGEGSDTLAGQSKPGARIFQEETGRHIASATIPAPKGVFEPNLQGRIVSLNTLRSTAKAMIAKIKTETHPEMIEHMREEYRKLKTDLESAEIRDAMTPAMREKFHELNARDDTWNTWEGREKIVKWLMDSRQDRAGEIAKRMAELKDLSDNHWVRPEYRERVAKIIEKGRELSEAGQQALITEMRKAGGNVAGVRMNTPAEKNLPDAHGKAPIKKKVWRIAKAGEVKESLVDRLVQEATGQKIESLLDASKFSDSEFTKITEALYPRGGKDISGRAFQEKKVSELYPHERQEGLGRDTKKAAEEGNLQPADKARPEIDQQAEIAKQLKEKGGDGKKYSMESDRIAKELGLDGIPVAHDSPIRHDGKFDWRKHSGKGEGNAAFGKGTYLSTAEGVHKSYKRGFSQNDEAQVSVGLPNHPRPADKRAALDQDKVFTALNYAAHDLYDAHQPITGKNILHEAQHNTLEALSRAEAEWKGKVIWEGSNADAVGGDITGAREVKDKRGPGYTMEKFSIRDNWQHTGDVHSGFTLKDSKGKTLGEFATPTEAKEFLDPDRAHIMWDPVYNENDLLSLRERHKFLNELKPSDIDVRLHESATSPTYHGVLNAGDHEILDWSVPLADQNIKVRQAAIKALKEADNDLYRDQHSAAGFNSSKPEPGSFADASPAELAKLTGQQLYGRLSNVLGSDTAASDALQKAGLVGHKYPAVGGKQSKFPNYVVYDDSKIHNTFVQFSNHDIGEGKVTPEQIEQVRAYFKKTLGMTDEQTAKIFKDFKAAGEKGVGTFETGMSGEEIMHISMSAANPHSVAYHEAMHALFSRIVKADPAAARTLLRAATSPHIQARLRELLKGKEEALKQLDYKTYMKEGVTEAEARGQAAEESLSYMYQFSAAGEKGLINLGPETKTFFGKVKNFMRKLAAIWSSNVSDRMAVERAGDYMAAFHDGKFANKNTVAEVLRERFPRDPEEQARKLFPWLGNFMDKAIWTAGGVVRDMNFEPLTDIIGKFHTDVGTQGKEVGFDTAKHAAYSYHLNKVTDAIKSLKPSEMREVLDEMREGKENSEPAKKIRKVLDDVWQYMVDKGVKNVVWVKGEGGTKGHFEEVDLKKVNDHYVPRVFDHQELLKPEVKKAFFDMLERNAITGEAAEGIYSNVTRDADTGKPHLDQNLALTFFTPQLKERGQLGSIPDAELAPFLNKDLFGTMSQYISRAARRAEYAERFGNQGQKIVEAKAAAKAMGMNEQQEAIFDQSIRAHEGTLGLDMNPKLKNVYSALMTYQNVRLLPLQLLSSLVDPGGIMIRGGTIGDALHGFTRGVKELFTGLKEDERYRFAKLVGTIDASVDAHLMSEMASAQYMPKTLKVINEAFFKYNGMEGWNRSQRIAATSAAHDFIVKHAEAPTEHSERYLKELNLTKEEVLKAAKNIDGSTRLDPENEKIRNAINQWVDEAILRPTASNRPIYMSDPNWMLISHLKQYSYLFQKVLISRVANEMAHGNYSPAFAMAGYVPAIIASDILRMTITPTSGDNDLRAGWTTSDWVMNGVSRAGLLGPSQLGFDFTTDLKRGKTGAESIIGPMGQQMLDFVRASAQGNPGHEIYKAVPGLKYF